MQRDAVEGDGDASPIAAFAVAKGGVVIKHIFLNAPPPDVAMKGAVEEEEEDPPVLIGRHPDCHVLVDHPSVSRFHLQLRARRRQRRITVTDLSSVHGTWVSGRRIPPNTPVDLAAGDMLRLGASRREYRLLWLTLREAFEMEDPLPPLLEEEKEEAHTHQEANNQLATGNKDLVDINIHKDTSKKIVSENIAFPVVIPSAPPLPEFAQSFYEEESALSQFHENCEELTKEKLIDKSPVSESLGSLVIQDMPAAVTSAGRYVQSAKQDASIKVSKRAKLKSVKSLRVDTGRNMDRSSTLNYSQQKEDQNDIVACSQNCGTECTACIALFGISECQGTYIKEEMIAEEKGHMNPPASITMEENKKEPTYPEIYIPQDLVDEKSEKSLLYPVELPEPVSENTHVPEVKLNGLNTMNFEKSISNNENVAPNMIAEDPEDCQFEGSTWGNLFGTLYTKDFQGNEENSPLDKENITPDVSGNIIMERSNRGLKPNISQELMDSISPLYLEHDIFPEKENSVLNSDEMMSNKPTSENLCLLISADTKLQQDQTEFMPISHLEFNNEILSDTEHSVLAPGKYDASSPVKQEDLFSDKENVTPISRNGKLSVRRVLGSRMDDSVSAENTSNTGIRKLKCNELSAKSKGFHTGDDDVVYSDKENLTPTSSRGMKTRRCFPKNFTVDADQDQEALFSDKENLTPQSSAARKTRDMSENRARIESAITKKRVADRLPFQTLLSNSPLRPPSSLGCNCAVARAAAAGGVGIRLEDELEKASRNHQESGRTVQGMKAWTMVADTDSLLDDESMKSIMLLRGIKGTHLIIPRIVIRELDSMKQREGLFRRSSKATSILQWIDECMENESWWIHVQSSSEMFPIAPTPPATPSSAQCIDEEIKISSGSFNPMALFSPRSFVDIISPKPEDRVLDCALLFKKLRSGQNMVILSNSITLKIKAMAEGLLCEGAKEFRESLMNPCSDRFMWAASVPRGSAWSCLDQAALAENYYNSHHHERKRTPKPVEAAKGLKLILRHNSLFAQATNPARKAPLATLASV
ncbi:hypothetical protein EJB05_53647 [Eragrostis curvula]|uniref:FHA domain-containing protein n=1 Tax=Eragrostis curvula TaxID=38414 RepID=A0A5J9SPK5_9POAL|nr:hypothetical protein EJB05_53647 [Eragrostis curvula]